MRKIFHSLVSIFILSMALSALLGANAHAFGKKRKTDPNPDVQAYPARLVTLGNFRHSAFSLPNGQTLDMSSALPLVVLTQMSAAGSKLRATAPDAAPSRYRMSGGLTSFEAEIASLGIKFGWKPGVGDIGSGTLSSVNGAVKVNVGELGMDFYIEDTVPNEDGSHTVIVAKHASAKNLGLELEATVDFGAIDTGLNFVTESPMAPLFAKMIKKMLEQMTSDPRTNFLMQWQAKVKEVDYKNGFVYFDSGMRDGVVKNNVFTVSEGFKRIGEIKVDEQQLEYSRASYKNDSSKKLLNATEAGDVVEIYFKDVPK